VAELVLDARDGRAFTRVAGVPLVCRHLRLAARAGRKTALVLGDARRVDAALADRPARIAVTVEDRAPREGEAAVDATLVAGLEPPLAVTSEADAREAEGRLLATLRKTVALDGVVAFHVMRPLSRLVTRRLLDTRVGPNHVTLTAMAFGVAAAVVAAGGGYARGAIAGVLLWIGAAIDCVDGELARLRVEGSKTGEWLDSLADDTSTMGLLLGLGLGLGGWWATLGAVGFVAGALTSAKIYADLSRQGMTIDSAQYPWFFGKPSAGGGGPVAWASYLFRRDAFVTVLALLLLSGAQVAAFLALFGGTAIVAGLMVVHLIVRRA
jgi:phosphatidylglycerophosphate synthase